MNKIFLLCGLLISVMLIGTNSYAKVANKGAKKHSKVAAKTSPKELTPEQLADLEKDVVRFPGSTSVPVLAKQAILMDYNTGIVLLEKNPDQRMTPSSLTKMMTSYVIEEKLQKKELSLQTTYPVSEKAWRLQGSKMFVPLGQMVSLQDLLRGIIIQSGNDACVVAAEGISGGEQQFVAEMNAQVKKLNMVNTQFKNSHGLPEEGQYSTARDLAILGRAIIKDHPDYYGMYQEKDFTYNGIKQGNRNPLIYNNFGCDGIKTGHTDDGGYGVVVSCTDDTQRYILALNGLSSMQERAEEARKLIAWAKANFVNKVVIKKGDVIEPAAKVALGLKETVRLAAASDVRALVLRTNLEKIPFNVVLKSEIKAPVKEGDQLGTVIVEQQPMKQEIALVSLDASEKMGLVKRAMRYLGVG